MKKFFYPVIVFSLLTLFTLFYTVTQACNIDTNRSLIYSGTSYFEEPLTLTHSNKGRGLSFVFNNLEFYYNQSAKSWCYLESTTRPSINKQSPKAPSQFQIKKASLDLENQDTPLETEDPSLNKKSLHLSQIQETQNTQNLETFDKDICDLKGPLPLKNSSGKTLAYVESKDNKIFIWSEQNEKLDKTLPYLVIQDDSQIITKDNCAQTLASKNTPSLSRQLVTSKVSLNSQTPSASSSSSPPLTCPGFYRGRLKVEAINKNKDSDGMVTYLSAPSLNSLVQVYEKNTRPDILFTQSGQFIKSSQGTSRRVLEIANSHILVTPGCSNSDIITPKNNPSQANPRPGLFSR